MKNKKIFGVLGVAVMLCINAGYAKAETYLYDELNRVTKVIYENGSYVEYEYDSSGNMIDTIVYIPEEVQVTQKPSATPTPSVTAMPAAPSATPTSSVTAMPAVPSATPTSSATVTPRVTATPTPRITATPTPRITVTPTPRVTATPTPSATPTLRATATPRATVTPAVPSATPTPRVTAMPTPSVMPTPVPDVTGVPTPTPEDGDKTEPSKEEYFADIFGPFTEKIQVIMNETVRMCTEVFERVETILRGILKTFKIDYIFFEK